jgi:hypothetical protein
MLTLMLLILPVRISNLVFRKCVIRIAPRAQKVGAYLFTLDLLLFSLSFVAAYMIQGGRIVFRRYQGFSQLSG